MGPWTTRTSARAAEPPLSFDALAAMVSTGELTPETPVRGPTTRQLWLPAAKAPGVSALLSTCHACAATIDPAAANCPNCDADITAAIDRARSRDRLGLPPRNPLPDRSTPAHAIAHAALNPIQHDDDADDPPALQRPDTPTAPEALPHTSTLTTPPPSPTASPSTPTRERAYLATIIALTAITTALAAALALTLAVPANNPAPAQPTAERPSPPTNITTTPETAPDPPSDTSTAERPDPTPRTDPAPTETVADTTPPPPPTPATAEAPAPQPEAPEAAPPPRPTTIPLDPAAEPYRDDIVPALALPRTDAALLESALTTLTQSRREILNDNPALDPTLELTILDSYIASRRAELNRIRLEQLLTRDP